MNELKSSKQAAVSFGFLAALGMGPSVLQKPALEMLSEKATMVLTNVPGPQQPLYLGGGQVKQMMFWVPQNGSIGMGVSILSYNGMVFFGSHYRPQTRAAAQGNHQALQTRVRKSRLPQPDAPGRRFQCRTTRRRFHQLELMRINFQAQPE